MAMEGPEIEAAASETTARASAGKPGRLSRAAQSGAAAIPSGKFNPTGGQRTIATAWMAGLAIIAWQEIKVNRRPPDPKRLVGWSSAMGILSLIAPLITFELAGVFAVGLALGLAIFRKPKASPVPGKSAPKPTNSAPTPPANSPSIAGLPAPPPNNLSGTVSDQALKDLKKRKPPAKGSTVTG